MSSIWLVACLLLGMSTIAAQAQLKLLPVPELQQVFGGGFRTITLTWHNPGQKPFSQELSTRLYQASSATIVPLGTAPWRSLEILPGQTVIESASLVFPAVNAETRFVIQWLAGTNQVLGTSEALVYPPSLLKELKSLAGEEPLAVLDPQDLLKSLLKAAAVEFLDFEDANIENYPGKLVIVGPFQNKTQMREGLASQLRARPSFYAVPEGKGTVVVVQASLTASLSERPEAQLNLIQFARLALQPETPRLPDLP